MKKKTKHSLDWVLNAKIRLHAKMAARLDKKRRVLEAKEKANGPKTA